MVRDVGALRGDIHGSKDGVLREFVDVAEFLEEVCCILEEISPLFSEWFEDGFLEF